MKEWSNEVSAISSVLVVLPVDLAGFPWRAHFIHLATNRTGTKQKIAQSVSTFGRFLAFKG